MIACSSTRTASRNGACDRAHTISNDFYVATQEQDLVIAAPGVLGNDNDPDVGDTITVAAGTVTQPATGNTPHGSVTVNPSTVSRAT